MSELHLRTDIDPLNLHKELEDQATMFHDWAKAAAESNKEYQQAKSGVDLVYAEVEKLARQSPEEFGIGKVTESTIKSAVMASLDYQDAVERRDAARYEYEMHQAAVNALEHKKRALTLLVELWVRDYYSEVTSKPHEPSTMDDESRSEVRSRGRRRKEKKEMIEDEP